MDCSSAVLGNQRLRRTIASEAKVIGELRPSGWARRRKEADPEALEAELAFIVISDSLSLSLSLS